MEFLNEFHPVAAADVPIREQLAKGGYPYAQTVGGGGSLEGYRFNPCNMGIGYRVLVRPALRVFDSEKSHSRALRALRIASSNPLFRATLSLLYKPRKHLPITRFGQTYQHPFGIAAGLDKKAEALRGWESLGLAFIEIGGITQHEQDGNPKPRMFRASNSMALVNRMGFNNAGSEKTATFLKTHITNIGKPSVPLWANLGKSKITPLEESAADYATTMTRLWKYVDVFVINVSSPNTPNLRELQHDSALESIINSCRGVNQTMSEKHGTAQKPLLVKIAPDLTDDQLHAVVKTARLAGCDGIVATNTTVERSTPSSSSDAKVFAETGGLSGAPLLNRSTEMIHKIYQITDGDWPIVGVGGIMSAQDAWEKIGAGACLLQAYSGFVFEGAGLTKSVVHGLHKKLRESPYSTFEEAIGFSYTESRAIQGNE